MFTIQLRDFVKWCSCQRDGIKIIEPSDNLHSSYFKLAGESLESMNANINAGVKRWALVAAYYARYHALYAVLMKIGIKCEIHDCTLAVAKLLLDMTPEFMKEIEKAKEHRINMQYYADRIVSDIEYNRNISSAAGFVIEMEEIASKMTRNDMENIRGRLEEIIRQPSKEK